MPFVVSVTFWLGAQNVFKGSKRGIQSKLYSHIGSKIELSIYWKKVDKNFDNKIVNFFFPLLIKSSISFRAPPPPFPSLERGSQEEIGAPARGHQLGGYQPSRCWPPTLPTCLLEPLSILALPNSCLAGCDSESQVTTGKWVMLLLACLIYVKFMYVIYHDIPIMYIGENVQNNFFICFVSQTNWGPHHFKPKYPNVHDFRKIIPKGFQFQVVVWTKIWAFQNFRLCSILKEFLWKH